MKIRSIPAVIRVVIYIIIVFIMVAFCVMFIKSKNFSTEDSVVDINEADEDLSQENFSRPEELSEPLSSDQVEREQTQLDKYGEFSDEYMTELDKELFEQKSSIPPLGHREVETVMIEPLPTLD